jgi:hypothetical protein
MGEGVSLGGSFKGPFWPQPHSMQEAMTTDTLKGFRKIIRHIVASILGDTHEYKTATNKITA